MVIEKVGIYRKWQESVPKENGAPIPRSQWPRKRRHRWVVRWYGACNKRYGKVFGTRREAENYASKLQMMVRLGKADRLPRIAVRQFRLEHEVVMQGQVSEATLRDQSRALRFFENFIGASFVLSKITPRHVEAFVAKRLSEAGSVATVNKDIRTLKSIFNIAAKLRGYLHEDQNPFANIKQRKTTEREIRYVSIGEYHKLMSGAEKLWWRALLSVAYGSGLRRSEILNLVWSDIDFENQRIKITAKKASGNTLQWEPKNRKKRIVPMSGETFKLLVDMQNEAPEGHPYAFLSVSRLEQIKKRQKASIWHAGCFLVNNLNRDFDVIRRRVNVTKCTIHDLRRSAITNWAKKLPIQVVQTLAGHSSMLTTRKYYLAVRPEDLVSAGDLTNSILLDRLQTDTFQTPTAV